MWNRATNVYPLDEDSGSTANDYSGNENHGTANGGAGPSGTGTSDGPFETTAWDFDGSDDYISSGSNGPDNEITVSLWININTVESQYYISNRRSDGGSNTDAGWSLYYSGTNDNIKFQSWSAQSTSTTVTGTSPSANTWVHLAASWDGSTLRLYEDGVKVGEESQSSRVNGDVNIEIGRDPRDSTLYFDGSISNIQIFDRALTPQEVSWFHEVTERGKYRGPEITL